ncbi:MAG: iron export ABC transporter permease subunit FetB [Gammaproteobacteria bacterium]|jgi:putative ABC transport system permease protein|nr:iron export ABC transporter permease subunit FetB [Gammaproteobacteria bacterium]
MVELSVIDLGLAAALVLLLALLSIRLRSNISQQLVIAALRTAVQLTLIGLVLKLLFANATLGWVLLMALIMLLVAGREVMARQERRFRGWWGYAVGTFSMFLSSFAVTLFALLVILGEDPWYTPQYAIPLLGMLLGNTMNGIAIAMDRLTQAAWEQRAVIEARLMLGERWEAAISEYRRQAIRSGMIPIINAMAAAGIVSLPGMMTGQILAGAAPVEAVKYQILIMFLITTGTGLGTLAAVSIGSKHLFDERQRLCLNRLRQP